MLSTNTGESEPLRPGRVPALIVALVASAGLLLTGGEASAQEAAAQESSTAPAFSAVEDLDLQAALEEVRQATAKFWDIAAAREAGYIRDPMNMCVVAGHEGMPAQLGEMGIHFFRPDLLGITQEKPRVHGTGTHTDFTSPGVLVYEPQPDGSMELVAVENLVFKEAWDDNHEERPTFHGLEYFLMVNNPRTEADEAHGFRPHYELHLWVHRENPVAVFAQFNPNVPCEHHRTRTQASGQ